jgi:hypothetical protein
MHLGGGCIHLVEGCTLGERRIKLVEEGAP